MDLSSRTPRIALIGCGIWGKNHARNLHQLGVLCAIVDPKAEAIAAQYHVPIFKTLAALLYENPPDALVIAAPDIYHYDMARTGLEAGLDLFVEKPLAMDESHAQILCAKAKRDNRMLMTGHLLRYHPAFQTLLQAALSGMIGDLQHILSIRHDIFESPRDTDLIWGYGPHDSSMVMALAGDTALQAASFYGDPAKECLLLGHFADGMQATISLSWQSPKKRLVVVSGTEGQLIFDDAQQDGEKIMAMIGDNEAQILPYTHDEPLQTELSHFVDSLKNRTEPLTGIEESLRTMSLLDICAKIAKARPQTGGRQTL